MVLFGVMHSPMNDQMFLPTAIATFEPAVQKMVIDYAVAYLMMSVIVYGYGMLVKDKVSIITTDEEFEALGE